VPKTYQNEEIETSRPAVPERERGLAELTLIRPEFSDRLMLSILSCVVFHSASTSCGVR
jgi:hypothetical protein